MFNMHQSAETVAIIISLFVEVCTRELHGYRGNGDNAIYFTAVVMVTGTNITVTVVVEKDATVIPR